MKYLLIILVVLGGYSGIQSVSKTREEKPKPLMWSKIDDTVYVRVSPLLSRLNESPNFQFHCWRELYTYLQEERIPYPEVWTQVAILESGWNLESGLSREGNNIFGFVRMTDTLSANVGYYAGTAYGQYKSHTDAIKDLKLRLKYLPMSAEENPYVYLQRTGYNTNPVYFYTLQQIKFWEGNKQCQ